jgi:putative DNA methylase
MRSLQQGAIAPVDMSQAAIGPGMGIYSSYSKVIETDGSEMTVRTALSLINQTLFETLSEQEGDFDADTRFCLKWFEQFEWSEGAYGDAETLSKAMNSGLEAIARGGILNIGGGKVNLLHPEQLGSEWDAESDDRISEWEVLVQAIKKLSSSGINETALLIKKASVRVNIDSVRELAFQLYGICERKGWAQSGALFNIVGGSWIDIRASEKLLGDSEPVKQAELTFGEDTD